MDYRSKIDDEVIAAWAVIKEGHKNDNAKTRLILCFSIVFLLVISFTFHLLFPLFLVFLAFLGLLGLYYDDFSTIKCPYCGESPISKSSHIGGVSPIGAEFCVHCFYYLERPPRAGDKKRIFKLKIRGAQAFAVYAV